jgi:hypothetical protein
VQVSRPTTRGLEKGIDLPPDIAAQVERLRGGGMPLPARERAIFEPLLCVDLGSVRLHTGVAAMQSASALNARAYTVGSDIAFGSGQYRPGTNSGRKLLVHELVHTVQQRDTYPGAEASSVQCKGGAGRSMVEEDRRQVRTWGHLTITHDIQWHLIFGPFFGPIDSLLLFIDVSSVARHGKPLSPMKVAAWSVSILKKQGGIRFKDGMGGAFTAYVARNLERYGFGPIRYTHDLTTLLDYVEPQSLQELRARFPKDLSLADFGKGGLEPLPVVAQDDYADPTEKLQGWEQERREQSAESKREQWAESKEATIRKLIDKARQQKPRPQDLPGKVSARKGVKDWYLVTLRRRPPMRAG